MDKISRLLSPVPVYPEPFPYTFLSLSFSHHVLFTFKNYYFEKHKKGIKKRESMKTSMGIFPTII